ncbi:MAG: ATP-binding protein, partial [Bacteroidota bacterium]|nr:ATP-binding protein [Bacteroidota bacterium]
MKYTAQELFELLNLQDECTWIEAKGGIESTHTLMETVCAFCNEPDLDGGYIVMGVAENHDSEFPQYKVVEITETDKLQKDVASQTATMFNIPIRPKMLVEQINGKTVVKIKVEEVPEAHKPIFFKSEGLPCGAMRRIGSTDQHCTEDDMHVFYQNTGSYDQTPIMGISISHIDENALNRYRSLREKTNPAAEELTYNNAELLEALGCVNIEKKDELNLAGLLLFGSKNAQRRTFPMLRIDYIRVPGNKWVENPDERFTSIDMQGPLMLMIYRLIDAINSDLPKGFLLQEGEIQAKSTGLPIKSLREALINAMMHRSYREHSPTQVIRYDNRIEIINPGFSLKSEDKLGEPGSETRNPFIAAVFHETNLAETKGTGIRAMRRLMEQSHLAPPTFESSREDNKFTLRLLLHHFLNESDLEWLKNFKKYNLSNTQKQSLIFIREVGAIDNHTYRQMADCDTLKASVDLKAMKEIELIMSKGKGKATYYVHGVVLTDALRTKNGTLSTEVSALSTEADALSTEAGELSIDVLFDELPNELVVQINSIKERERNKEKAKQIIMSICAIRPYKLNELSIL